MLERTTITQAELPDLSVHVNPRLLEFVDDGVPYPARDYRLRIRLAEVEPEPDGTLRLRGEVVEVAGEGPFAVGEEATFHADCSLPGARVFDLTAQRHHLRLLAGVELIDARFGRTLVVPIGDLSPVRA